MTSGANQNSVVVFLVTMSLIPLLALGVYASNRLLTEWLIIESIDQSISHVPTALESAGSSDNAPKEAPEPGTPRPDDLALRSSIDAMPPSALAWVLSKSGNTLSRRAWDIIDTELKPGHLLAGYFADQGVNKEQPFNAAEIHASLQQAGQPPDAPTVSVHTIAKALEVLPGRSAPFTQVDMSLSGHINPNVLVVLPQFGADGSRAGAVFLISQQRDLVEGLSGITALSSGLITALCSLSILIAAALLWMRFRDRMRTNRDMEYLAHHDTLTGLPNRAVFNARLNESLRLSQAQASNLGVMLIDVDRFKEINDTFGHGTGDLFLQIIADRLKSVFGDHLVARLSGDEFAIMTTTVSDVTGLTRLASDMIAATSHPSIINGKEISFSLSIGIARASDGNWRASQLLHCADLALYSAKRSGRSTFIWYAPQMDADAKRRKEIEIGLIKALKFNQFELVYQPQYSLTDDQLKGYESLIRWNHPSKGVVFPDTFIPVAEETGLIEQIGDWVLHQACREASSWTDPDLRIAVNVSGAQFVAGETQKKVAKALRETGLDPKRLEIEITESLLISDTDAVVDTLQQIRGMGVSIAMDDFGTGYSSLSYLNRFPFDKIKIDRSFIKNLGHEASTDAVVASIIGLGRSLDILITAEGVETPEQSTLLRAAGCDLVQGFLYGRPGTIQSHEHRRAQLSVSRIGDVKKRASQEQSAGVDGLQEAAAGEAVFHAHMLTDDAPEPRALSG